MATPVTEKKYTDIGINICCNIKYGAWASNSHYRQHRLTHILECSFGHCPTSQHLFEAATFGNKFYSLHEVRGMSEESYVIEPTDRFGLNP
jgi:hypothetical protein